MYQHFYIGQFNSQLTAEHSLLTMQIQNCQSQVKQYYSSGKTDLRVLCIGVKCIMVSAFTMYWSSVHLSKNKINDKRIRLIC